MYLFMFYAIRTALLIDMIVYRYLLLRISIVRILGHIVGIDLLGRIVLLVLYLFTNHRLLQLLLFDFYVIDCLIYEYLSIYVYFTVVEYQIIAEFTLLSANFGGVVEYLSG